MRTSIAERLRMRELIAPLPMAAVALMVVNDRVLKRLYHNGLTGKLSDLAICFFLPLYVSAVLGLVWPARPRGRLLVGSAVAAFVFIGQEVWPGFQALLLACLHFVGGPLGLGHFTLTSDPTDLWALAMLPLAFAYGRRRLATAPRQASPTQTSMSGSGPEN